MEPDFYDLGLDPVPVNLRPDPTLWTFGAVEGCAMNVVVVYL